MLFKRKETLDIGKFWRDYEEKIQAKVLAKSLGRYVSGWHEYAEPLWGLAIAASDGFRFHHFPHEGWLMALTRVTTGGEPPTEKTIFIPKDRILSAELRMDKNWLRRLFLPTPPTIILRYALIDGGEAEVLVETEKEALAVVENLPGSK